MRFVIQWVENCEGSEMVVKIRTPVAKLVLTFRGDVITGADWEPDDGLYQSEDHPLQQEFDRFWKDANHSITVKLLRQGSTFRNKVWAELCRIPLGATISYSALAGKIGSAARAVGNACRDNPYPLIVPCHRVVSVKGLGGYSGQTEGNQLEIKIKLLELEKAGKA